MDTFVDSSWYFLRYLLAEPTTTCRSTSTRCDAWLPVDQYVGGVAHAILHLLYARFFTKVLHDLGMVDFDRAVHARCSTRAWSSWTARRCRKSRGNLVRLSDELATHGVDAVRLTMVFAGPPEDDIDWADVSPAGSAKFLARVWRLAGDVTLAASAPTRRPVTSRCARSRTGWSHDATRRGRDVAFNVAVARLMELVNATRKAIDSGARSAPTRRCARPPRRVAVMLSLFAPYTAEEMWERLGHEPPSPWCRGREVDPALLVEDTVTCVVQVAGKVRDRLEVPPDIAEDALRELALASEAVQRALDGRGSARSSSGRRGWSTSSPPELRRTSVRLTGVPGSGVASASLHGCRRQ